MRRLLAAYQALFQDGREDAKKESCHLAWDTLALVYRSDLQNRSGEDMHGDHLLDGVE